MRCTWIATESDAKLIDELLQETGLDNRTALIRLALRECAEYRRLSREAIRRVNASHDSDQPDRLD
jgi:metal-responsive CopG/Arc/MetJ family transcriptional regulator